MKKLFRIIGYSIVIIIFLMAIVIGVTQTAFFKDVVRQFVEDEASSHLNGELTIGKISGTFVTGITLEDIEWLYDNERAIYVKELEVRINPINLLQREVLVTNLLIRNPDVRLIVDDEGVLNISQLVKKREDGKIEPTDTVELEPSDSWLYTLKDFELHGGSFSYYRPSDDALTKSSYPVSFPKFDSNNITLKNIYISMAVNTDGRNFGVDIRSMNFTMRDPDLHVSHLSLQAAFSPARTQINRMRVITDRSNINLTGGINGYNILGGNEGRIEEKEMDVSLFADRLHTGDLKMFIPELWFLEEDAEVSIDAGGTLDDPAVEYISLSLGRTNLALSGTVTNATDADRLFIDASFTDSQIDPGDVNAMLPHFNIPDFSHLGVIGVEASYTGNQREFNSTIDINSTAGYYSGEVDMDLTQPSLVYNGNITTRDADLAILLKQDNLPVDLSGRVMLDGKGTSFEDLVADAELAIEHMKIAGLDFDSLNTNISAHNYDLQLNTAGYFERSKFSIDAASSIHDIDKAPFDIQLAVESLDLSRVMKDTAYVSDLTFSMTGSGTGLRPESMFGEIAMEIEPSRFREYDFVGDPVYVSLVEIDTSFRELNINSEIADVYLAGEFDLPTILDISFDHVRHLISSVRYDIRGIVTGDVAGVEEFGGSLQIDKPIDTVYDIDIKNMDAVAVLLGQDAFDIEVEGKLYGYFRTVEQMLRLGGDIEIDHFLYLSETDRILLDKITGSYNIDNDYRARGLEGIYSMIDISADGVYTGSLAVNGAALRADIRGNDWTVFSEAFIDTLLNYEVDAVAYFDSTSLNVDLNTFSIGYEKLLFGNQDSLALRYDNQGVWFEDFALYHNDASKIEMSGLYAFDKEHSIDFSLSNIELEDIHRTVSPERELRRQPFFSGMVDVTGRISGTTEELDGVMEVSVAGITYGDLTFGLVSGNFDYSHRRLDFNADVASTEDTAKTAFKIGGYIPLDLLPADGGERIPDGSINVQVFSEGFDLSIIDPFLGDIRNFSGRMTSDVTISGTVEEPRYEGNLEIDDGQFVFIPNNMTYHFNGKLEPQQNELVISHLYLDNRRRDFSEGRIRFSGSVQTRGLTIRDFDLQANGQLQVLRTGARRPGDAVYGDLIIGTGSDGVRLVGSLDESRLTGSMLIRSAALTIPPVRTTAYDRSGTIVNYIAIDDTEPDEERLTPLEMFFRDVAQERGSSQSQQETGSTFIDGLDYDLTIQTDGRVEMTMIFNQTTGEELVARIATTSLRLYHDELTGLRLVGNVDIVEPSAYSFYRKFDARGRISFVGPPDNPEFDITATYTGQRVQVQRTGADVDDPVRQTGAPEQVEVRLHITGDRYEPQLDISLFVDNEQREGDVETDAISYILTGRFQTDLQSGDYRTISTDFGRGIPATFMSGVATSLLSNLFSDFLRNEVRFIRTAEIVWYGGNIMDTAELRISGELRNFYWTIGGRVFNDLGNTNFSFQIPMGPVFNSDSWTNMFLELERRSQSIEFSEEQRPVNAARLYYSISF